MASSRLAIALVVTGFALLDAQVCRLSVAGLNRSRHVKGNVHAECPEEIVHTAPFGNWGVTSNFGNKTDSHQFDGWCHNTRVCDNAGTCWTDCMDGWYEWNSCTDNSLFTPKNCTLYNSADCTEQSSTTGVDVHGTKYVDIPVRCPTDSQGTGTPDTGGCKDVTQYATGRNFMSMYELDPICCDDLVQTVYFPEATLTPPCDALGCASVASDWLSPSGWDSPATPVKITAELAVIVNWGAFIDTGGSCPATNARSFNIVSGASFKGPSVATSSIGTLLGNGLAPAVAQAASYPLPAQLGGISVGVRDSAGNDRPAGLFYVSPSQVNFEIPPGTALGAATITTYSGNTARASGTARVETVAPALFTQNASGTGVAAAYFVRVTPAGTQATDYVFSCGAAPGSCVPKPIDMGNPLDRTYLVLFGTGIRNRSALTGVGVVIGGENARVEYAGLQPQYAGLDQVNVLVPDDMRGRGVVDVALTADSKPANTVQVAFR